MAFAIELEGTQYFTTTLYSNVAGSIFEIRFRTNGVAKTFGILSSTATASNAFIRVNSSGQVRARGVQTGNNTVMPNGINVFDGEWHVLRVHYFATSHQFELDGFMSAVNNQNVTFDGWGVIGSFFNNSTFEGQIEYARWTNNGTNNRDWDANFSDRSNTGQQPELTDTVNASNAIGVNFATDGSAWRDTGGGGDENSSVILGDIPFIGSSLSLSNTPPPPQFNTAISGNLPFLDSSLVLSHEVNSYDISIAGDLPFLSSALEATQSVPEYDSSIDGNVPFLTSDLTLSPLIPEYDTVISGDLPFIGSDLVLSQVASGVVAVIEGDLPFIGSNLSLSQVVPEYDATITGDLPFIGSTLVLQQEPPQFNVGISGDLPFLGSDLELSHGVPERDVSILGDLPFITSSLELSQESNSNNAEINGDIPFIGSSLTLTIELPPEFNVSISGDLPFISSRLFLTNRQVEPIRSVSAIRTTDTFNITYQTQTYTATHEE